MTTQTIHPERGGTGLSAVPAQNEILIGDGNGAYTKIDLATLRTLLNFLGFASMTVSATQPSSPAEGDLWVDIS